MLHFINEKNIMPQDILQNLAAWRYHCLIKHLSEYLEPIKVSDSFKTRRIADLFSQQVQLFIFLNFIGTSYWIS